MNDSALSHLRVIDCSQGIAGPFCSRLFADLGADVVKVEPPEGDSSRRRGPFPDDREHPEKSAQFLYNNTGKRSITLDLDSPDGRKVLHELAKGADILVMDLAPARLSELGLDYAALSADNPQLIMTCITPYGLQGPYRDYLGSELTAFHIGGLGVETPHNQVTDLAKEPPLKAGGYQASYLTGWTAATATMVAVMHRRIRGHGQQVDIAAMESVANMLRYTFAALSYHPEVVPSRLKYGFSWIIPCRDGHVSFLPFQFDAWWRVFVEMMGHPEWAQTEVFDDLLGRVGNADILESLVIEWSMQHSKQEIYQMALERGLPGFPVNNMREVSESRQFAFREFFTVVDHPQIKGLRQPGAFCRFSRTPIRIECGAPALGSDNPRRSTPWLKRTANSRSRHQPALSQQRDPARPLKGIRVAEFGWALAVPHATAWLAALGAEVIRIESRCRMDLVRVTPTGCADGVPGPNRSGFFNGLNYSKKSITLDLSKPEGRQLARELIAKSDIVTENFSVGVMADLGLDYESLRSIRPDLIMLSGSPLGQQGPESAAKGFGPNTQVYAGLPYMTGYPDGCPSGIGGNWPDYMVGVTMAFALMTALEYRNISGKGQYLDMAMAEVVAGMIPEALLDYAMNGREARPQGNDDPGMSPHGVYPCAGADKWLALAVENEGQWQNLKMLMGNPDWAARQCFDHYHGRAANQQFIDEQLAHWTAQFGHYELMHKLQQAGITAAPCLTALELMSDPQLQERGFLVNLDHPEVGCRRVAGLPGLFSELGGYMYRPAPMLGEHNDAIFLDLLGLDPAVYQKLQATQVIY